MSLAVVVKGPEGLVLAADTRVTVTAQQPGTPSPIILNYDNTTKVLSFSAPHAWVGAVTYGEALIGTRTAHSFVPELELKLCGQRHTVFDYAQLLSNFYRSRWEDAGLPSGTPNGGMSFIVGGYDENSPYGTVFLFNIPNAPEPEPRNNPDFGMTWGGQLEITSRIIHGYDPLLFPLIRERLNMPDEAIRSLEDAIKPRFEYTIPYDVLPLQDCVDLAIFLIRTTITAQNIAIGMRGVGGAIEVATVTRTGGLKWIQRKDIHGENLCSH